MQGGLDFPFLSTFVIICVLGVALPPGGAALCCSVACTFLMVAYSAFDPAWDSTMTAVCVWWGGVERLGSGHVQVVLSIFTWDFKGFTQEVSVGSRSQRAEGE